MRTTLTGGGVVALAGVALVAIAGLYVWSKRGAIADAAASVGQAVNPADSQNIVNRGVSAVVEAATGGKDTSLGGWLARITGADRDDEIAAMLKGSTPAVQATVEPIYDRWDYYAQAGRGAGSGSGSTAEREPDYWTQLANLGAP